VSEFRSVRGCFEQYTKDADERLRELAALRGALESEALGRCHALLVHAFDYVKRKVLPALQRAEELEKELEDTRAKVADVEKAVEGWHAWIEREIAVRDAREVPLAWLEAARKTIESERAQNARLRDACVRARALLEHAHRRGLNGITLPAGEADEILREALAETEGRDA